MLSHGQLPLVMYVYIININWYNTVMFIICHTIIMLNYFILFLPDYYPDLHLIWNDEDIF